MKYEYLAIPAPAQTKRVKGQKTAVERLATAMTDTMNEMADEGWEYLRTETLTIEDKPGRFAKIVERIETVLVFRRPFDYEEIETEQAAPIAEIYQSQQMREEPAILARQEVETSEPDEEEYVEEKEPAQENLLNTPFLGGASRD